MNVYFIHDNYGRPLLKFYVRDYISFYILVYIKYY